MPVIIRPVKLEDCEAVASLSNELGYVIEPAQCMERLAGIITKPFHLFIIAELEDGIVSGWAHAGLPTRLLIGRHVELYGLIVGKHWRNRGIGEKLLAGVEGWARERGCQKVLVRSNVIRERAHFFYKSRGYSEEKRQVFLVKTLD
jgi:GNAT superfamily N-acetyltransferase